MSEDRIAEELHALIELIERQMIPALEQIAKRVDAIGHILDEKLPRLL